MAASASITLWQRLRGLFLQRCPRCLRGKVFSGIATMNERCPVCDLQFEREPGYFMGAMYISYALSIGWLFALTGVIWWLTDWDPSVALLGAVGLYLPLVPVTWRYSRLTWMYFDHTAWPDER
jgi:uncharacterized protein (DUF983 family)